MKRIVLIVGCFFAILGICALGYLFWAYKPFWLKEGVCQLRPVRYPLDTYEYIPIIVATSNYSVDSTEPTKEDVQLFDINTPKMAFSGCLQKQQDSYVIMIDRNREGSFSNEEPIRGKKFTYKRPSPLIPWRFGPINVRLRDGTSSAPFNLIAQPKAHRVYVCPTKAYCGRIRLNNTVFRVYLNDTDFDGRFNTLFSPDLRGSYHPHCDSISFDRFQNVHTKDYRAPVEPLSRMLKIGQVYYAIQVTEQFQLKLIQTRPEMGHWVLKGIDSVSGKYWSDAVSGLFYSSDDDLALPKGRYSLEYFDVHSTNANGIVWKATSSNDLTESPVNGLIYDFEIKPAETSLINMGAPLQCRIEHTQKNDKIQLNLKLIGNAGERYDPRLSYTPDANKPSQFSKPSQPSFSIVNRQGVIIHEGQFEYG